MLRPLHIATATILVSSLFAAHAVGGGIEVARATTGVGGTISLGAASGASVPVSTTAATDAYAGFNIHARAVASPGVTLTGLSANAAGSTILSMGDESSVFCHGSVPAPGDFVFACAALNGQSTPAPGLLATLAIVASGNGCVAVRLITVAASNSDVAHLNTYTVNAPLAATEMQANTVDASVINILVGSGVFADCARLTSVGGVAQAPDLPDRVVSARSSPLWLDAIAIAMVLATVSAASGTVWYAFKRRTR